MDKKTTVKKTAASKAEKVTKPKTEKKEKKTSGAPISFGTGRRKSSIARVMLRNGRGNLVINGTPFDKYFDTEVSRLEATLPFRVIQDAIRYDVDVNVHGGGKEAQADAVKLGFSRALVSLNEALRPALKQYDLLSVDSRVKERKKYGQKGARRKFQFVKR